MLKKINVGYETVHTNYALLHKNLEEQVVYKNWALL